MADRKKKLPFLAHLKYRLNFRLLRLVALTIVPICVIAILVSVLTLSRASSEILASMQSMMDSQLNQIESDFETIDEEMDLFVSDYEMELDVDGYSEDPMVPYDMMSRLTEIMEHFGKAGFVYLYNTKTGKCYIQSINLNYSVDKIENMKQVIRLLTDQDSEIVYSYRKLKGYSFMEENFYYENYEVGYLFEIGSAIADSIASFYEQTDDVSVRIYSVTYELEADGTLNRTRLDWDTVSRNTFTRCALTWSGTNLPLEIVIGERRFYAFGLVPGYYYLLIFLTVFLICLLTPLFWKQLDRELIRPLGTLVNGMHQLQSENYDYRIENTNTGLSTEMCYVMDTFDEMADEVKASKEKDAKMYKAQLDNLRLQVNPHMLLNSYNMIYSLAQSRNFECIQKYSMHLVDYFRYVLRKDDDMVPLRNEMKFVSNFIEIQKIRFPNAFSSVYTMDHESCGQALVPPLLVENFVENAMKYSLVPGKVVEVLINVRKDNDRLLISIVDTGKGMKPEILEVLQKGEPYVDRFGNKHIGVWNCKRRIEVFYEEEAKINIISTLGEGTQVFLDLPFIPCIQETIR